MKRKIFLFLLKTFVLFIVLFSLFIGTVFVGGFGPIPSNKELTNIKQAQASIVFSDDNEILGKFYYQNRTQVAYKEIPKHLINALVATEDARFYEHDGIDRIAMLRVLVKTLILGDRSAGGGSTLSQQLAKNLYKRKNFSYLSMPVNKTKEAILAYRLEKIYSKKEILTLYLNTVPFGESVFGIESAAQRYFSVPAHKLTIEQSAVLVGMLKANTYYNPRKHPDHAKRRRNTVLSQMNKGGYITDKSFESLKKRPLITYYKNLTLKNPNGYFLYEVKKQARAILKNTINADGSQWDLEKDGLIIETTLIDELQKSALSARKEHLSKLQKTMDLYWYSLKKKSVIKQIIEREWKNTHDYKRYAKLKLSNIAMIDSAKKKEKRFVFDWKKNTITGSKIDSISHYLKMVNAAVYGVNTKTGAVQVYIGGNNFESLPYNLVNSERQSASLFKPFVFAAALETGEKPCNWISNEIKVYEDYDDWTPENYNHTEGGYYSMGGALAKSMNIPTIETYMKVGLDELQKTTRKVGLRKQLKNLPSIAIGATSYSLKDLVHAYIPFANRKELVAPYLIKSIKTPEGKVIYNHTKETFKDADAEAPLTSTTLETMQYLLKGVVDNGTASKLKTTYHANGSWAGKTGTAQNSSDAWFIGFNADFIIGAWVGCKYPAINLAPGIGGGSTAALPIVGKIIGKDYANSKIDRKLSAGFPSFDKDIIDDCDCPHYREENAIEKLFDIFDKKKEPKVEEEKKEKKKSFFKRLFGIK